MKFYLYILLILLSPVFAGAQHVIPKAGQKIADSLRTHLQNAQDDSARHEACRLLYNFYEESNRDSALYYAEQRLLLSKKNKKKINEAFSLGVKAYQLIYLGRFAEALSCLLQAFKIAEDPNNEEMKTWRVAAYPSPGKTRLLSLSLAHHMFGHLMLRTDNTEQKIFHFKEGRSIAKSIGNHFRVLVADMMLGSSYIDLNQPDSALFFAKEAEQMAIAIGVKRYEGYINFVLGDVYFNKGNKILANQYYHNALQSSIEQNNQTTQAVSYSRLIDYYKNEGKNDSVLFYAIKNLQTVRSMGAITAAAGQDINIGTAYQYMYTGYKLYNQLDSAFKYQGLALLANDSLYKMRIRNLAEFQKLSFTEQRRLQDLEKDKLVYRNRTRTYAMLAGVIFFLLIAVILFRNNRQKQKANLVLQQQKEKIEETLNELKSTQAQLIQSEKMASLGELTAGIAHEIQNPLNFVNNFSEVNKELLVELKEEVANGNLQEVEAIANDVINNQEKITHHGKRADAIVKGMLQHSRTSSGEKEPTNINALTDEYLRLAYHGLRAKDKTFNVTTVTDYDETIGAVNIIPGDIGRVILNLITNAFYAVNEKQKAESEKPNFANGLYVPTVTLATKNLSNKPDNHWVEINIKDNGNGIPEKVLDKIFQPFFTTKPTGEGTGLGLSLSYDIVKAHGGELKVETKFGEGSVFIMTIPVI